MAKIIGKGRALCCWCRRNFKMRGLGLGHLLQRNGSTGTGFAYVANGGQLIPMDGWFLVLQDQRGRGDGSSDRTLEKETEEQTEYRPGHIDTDSVWLLELEHDHDRADRRLKFWVFVRFLCHQSP